MQIKKKLKLLGAEIPDYNFVHNFASTTFTNEELEKAIRGILDDFDVIYAYNIEVMLGNTPGFRGVITYKDRTIYQFNAYHSRYGSTKKYTFGETLHDVIHTFLNSHQRNAY